MSVRDTFSFEDVYSESQFNSVMLKIDQQDFLGLKGHNMHHSGHMGQFFSK